MWGKWVCQEIKNNVLNYFSEIEALKIELQELITLGVPKLWKDDDSLVPKA